MPPTATGRLALLGVEPKYVQKIVCEPKLATTRAIEFGEYASDRRVPNWTCRCRVGYGVVSLPMWLRPLMIPNYLSHIYNLLNGSQIVHMLPLFLSFSFFFKAYRRDTPPNSHHDESFIHSCAQENFLSKFIWINYKYRILWSII